jgi:hypothetical protein
MYVCILSMHYNLYIIFFLLVDIKLKKKIYINSLFIIDLLSIYLFINDINICDI